MILTSNKNKFCENALKKLTAALLLLTFSLVNTSFADRNLAAGLASPGGISSEKDGINLEGDEDIREEMRASAKLRVIMEDPMMQRDDVQGQKEPEFPDGLGIDKTNLYLTREEALEKIKDDPVATEMLGYGLEEIFTRCIKKACVDKNGNAPSDMPIDIIHREFFIDVGEMALPRILMDSRWEKPRLQIPREFEVNTNRIIDNDICFMTEDGRVVSLAQGIMYRLARHEFKWRDHTGQHKQGGHLALTGDPADPYDIEKKEDEAYNISGKYSIINDAMMLWFVFAFHQNYNIYQDNNNFKELIRKISYPNNSSPQAIAFRTYFPELARSPEKLEKAVQFACCINYHYFIKILKAGREANGGISDVAILDVVNRWHVNREAVERRVLKILEPTENKNYLSWEFRASGHKNTGKDENETRASRGLAGVFTNDSQFFPEDPRRNSLSNEATMDLNVYEQKNRKVISSIESVLISHHLKLPPQTVFSSESTSDNSKFTVLNIKKAEKIYAESTGKLDKISPEELADFFSKKCATAVFIRIGGKEVVVKTLEHSIFGTEISARIKTLPAFGETDDELSEKAFTDAVAYGLTSGWNGAKSAMLGEIAAGMASKGRGLLNTNGFIDALRYMDLHRRYLTFMRSSPNVPSPTITPFTAPDENELVGLASDFMRKNIDYYVHASLLTGKNLKYAENTVREQLSGKIKTYSSLEDLARQLHSPSMAERACIDLCGLDETNETIENFFLENSHFRGARFLNSEYVNLTDLSDHEKTNFIDLFFIRMQVIRSLEKNDIETENNAYRLARYCIHPYLPLGANIHEYLTNIIGLGTFDHNKFADSIKTIVNTILRYRPMETYNIRELEYVIGFLISS